MNEACDICQFLAKKPLRNQVMTTKYWTVGVIPDQAYLGRAIISLLTHKGSLGALSHEEWEEFEAIIPKLERAYKLAFGADPLNIGSFMNHGFKEDPPHPHVHWHIFPRYKQPHELGGIVFEDDRYGEFFDDDARHLVNDAVVGEIVQQLQSYVR